LLGLYATLIAFGSLYPFTAWRPWRDWSGEFITAPLPPYITRTDISTNFLAYLPYGYLCALSLARPRHRGWAVFLASATGLCLSLALESLQQLVPGRIASNLDVFLNTLGTLTGGLLTLHHQRWHRAARSLLHWRRSWFRPSGWVTVGLWLLPLWALGQFSLLPFPGAGWLALHLRPIDTPPGGLNNLNLPWFFAVFLEMSALGAYTACLLRPGRYVSATVLLFVLAFASKLLAATLLLKLKVVGGVLSLETLAAFFLAFWFLLNPTVSRHRGTAAVSLLIGTLLVRLILADYLVWPRASVFNIVGLAKAVASLWPFLALGMLAAVGLAGHRGRARVQRPGDAG
jgi:VanZ family protein